jgi:hypothetical protein
MKGKSEELAHEMYEEKYNKLLEEYLDDGINYQANTIRKANSDDLAQLASDSFHQGYITACELLKTL